MRAAWCWVTSGSGSTGEGVPGVKGPAATVARLKAQRSARPREAGARTARPLAEAGPEARIRHPIVPRGQIAGAALGFVIAIMTFLASLTLGGVLLVADTARGWQSEIAREVTVQLRPLEERDMEADLQTVRRMALAVDGIDRVTVLGEEATSALLAPWLGSALDLETLPVPRLMMLGIDTASPPDLTAFRDRLEAQVPGAVLDDHRAWVERLSGMASATIFVGVAIFALMLAAAVLSVVFATRGAMAGNRYVIEVLHFVGADRGYIASQFQTHFLWLGLRGAVAGAVGAIVVFALAGLAMRPNPGDPAADQAQALFGSFSLPVTGYLAIAALALVVAVLTAMTSRLTVLRHVGTLDRSGGAAGNGAPARG